MKYSPQIAFALSALIALSGGCSSNNGSPQVAQDQQASSAPATEEYRDLTPADNITFDLKSTEVASEHAIKNGQLVMVSTLKGIHLKSKDKTGNFKDIELISPDAPDSKIETKQFGTILYVPSNTGVGLSGSFQLKNSQVKKLQAYLGF